MRYLGFIFFRQKLQKSIKIFVQTQGKGKYQRRALFSSLQKIFIIKKTTYKRFKFDYRGVVTVILKL